MEAEKRTLTNRIQKKIKKKIRILNSEKVIFILFYYLQNLEREREKQKIKNNNKKNELNVIGSEYKHPAAATSTHTELAHKRRQQNTGQLEAAPKKTPGAVYSADKQIQDAEQQLDAPGG